MISLQTGGSIRCHDNNKAQITRDASWGGVIISQSRILQHVVGDASGQRRASKDEFGSHHRAGEISRGTIPWDGRTENGIRSWLGAFSTDIIQGHPTGSIFYSTPSQPEDISPTARSGHGVCIMYKLFCLPLRPDHRPIPQTDFYGVGFLHHPEKSGLRGWWERHKLKDFRMANANTRKRWERLGSKTSINSKQKYFKFKISKKQRILKTCNIKIKILKFRIQKLPIIINISVRI